jgi:hypothetical protein
MPVDEGLHLHWIQGSRSQYLCLGAWVVDTARTDESQCQNESGAASPADATGDEPFPHPAEPVTGTRTAGEEPYRRHGTRAKRTSRVR